MTSSKLAPREARALVVSPRVRALLEEMRSLQRVEGAATDLDISALEAIEDEWKVQLPDDVLAVMASNSPWLTDIGFGGHGVALRHVGTHLETFYRHTSKDGDTKEWPSVPAAKRTLIPVGEGMNGFVCLRRSEVQDGTGKFVVVLHEGYSFLLDESQQGKAIPFIDWLTQERDALEESLQQSGTPSGKSSPPFEPKLVGESRKVVVPRRVVHPKFGVGTVVGTIDDKLEIDFESVGKKMLLEGFVKPA